MTGRPLDSRPEGASELLLPTGGTDSRRVEIVMTPDEWNDMASVAFGDFDYALDHVTQVLSGLGPAESFASAPPTTCSRLRRRCFHLTRRMSASGSSPVSTPMASVGGWPHPTSP